MSGTIAFCFGWFKKPVAGWRHKLGHIPIKSPEEIALMREACRVTVAVLDALEKFIKPGLSTEDINTYVHRLTLEMGARPSTLNYRGFPKSVCTSLNDVVCHGVPDPLVILKEGDIVNVDVTSYKGGFHGDASRMYFIGGANACSAEARDLVSTAKQALAAGITAVRPHGRVGDIGAAIQAYIDGTGKGYGIVREYTGHGIGREFHEPPQVVHVGRAGQGEALQPGMIFTVEPMINAGTYKTVLSKIDGWTVRTADGRLSAQWEHTVLVSETGSEILTNSFSRS